MTWTLWTRQEIALIVTILTFACVAAFLSVKLTRPKPFASRSLERAMAVHHDCGNREDLHQEARVTTSIAITR